MSGSLRAPIALALGGIVWAVAHWLAHRTVETAPHAAHGAGTVVPGYLTTSLALCLVLALALAASAALGPGRRTRPGRSLWLFVVVPVLGLAGEALVAGPSAAAAESLVELGLLVLAVQAAAALVALRLAHGLIDLAATLARSLAAPLSALRAETLGFPPAGIRRAPAGRTALGGAQRAPPAPLPARA